MEEVKLQPAAALPNPFASKNFQSALGEIEVAEPVIERISLELEHEAGRRPGTPNFPFFYPLIYHNISEDIPVRFRTTVLFAFLTWISVSLSLAFAVFGQFCSNTINSTLIVRWREILMSLFFFLLFPILMFYCQYWRIYKAARDEKSDFGISIAQKAVLAVMWVIFLGIPGTGMMGVGYTVICWNSGELSNVIVGVVFTGWHLINILLELGLSAFLASIIEQRGRLVNPVDRMHEEP